MLEFGYCIWLQPDKSSELYQITDGFEPHISLKTNMKYDEANRIFVALSMRPVTIEIVGAPYVTECEGFYALQYDVKIVSGTPSLWAENPHLSVVYRYDNPIEEGLIKLNERVVTFNKYTLMHCDSHYTKWYAVTL